MPKSKPAPPKEQQVPIREIIALVVILAAVVVFVAVAQHQQTAAEQNSSSPATLEEQLLIAVRNVDSTESKSGVFGSFTTVEAAIHKGASGLTALPGPISSSKKVSLNISPQLKEVVLVGITGSSCYAVETQGSAPLTKSELLPNTDSAPGTEYASWSVRDGVCAATLIPAHTSASFWAPSWGAH